MTYCCSKITTAIGTGIVFGITLFTAGCQPKAAAPFILPVSAKKIQTRSFEKVIQAQGTLSNPGYIQIRPQTSGLITQVLVKEGDAVNAGDILMTLNNKQELAELKTAKEELKQQIIEAKNTNYLVNTGAKPYIEIEQKRVEVVRAKSHMVAKQESYRQASFLKKI